MEVMWILIPLTLLIATGMVAAFIHTVHCGPLDDLDTPTMRILFDDDARGCGPRG